MAPGAIRATRYVLAFALLIAARFAAAATFCVGSASDLTLALQTAQANSEDNDVRIRVGEYVAPAAEGWHIDLLLGDFSLSVVGGFTDEACTQRTFDAFATVLDGAHAVRPLTIATSQSFGAANSDHHITVSGLTFRNGSDPSVGGLKVSDPGPIYGGIILIEGNAFIGNEAAPGTFDGGPALLAATDGPDFSGGTGLVVRNNLFAENVGPDASAAFVYSNNRVEFVNNTFTGNATTDETLTDRAVLRYFTFSGITLANNAFWANNASGAADVHDLSLTAVADLVNNDIETMVGQPGSDIGTLSVDPSFADAAGHDYALAADSPLIDAGFDTPAGGLSTFDLDGDERVQGAHVDIGAFEFGAAAADETIFADGFDAAP
jgi:hypothetical protein